MDASKGRRMDSVHNSFAHIDRLMDLSEEYKSGEIECECGSGGRSEGDWVLWRV